MQFSGKSPEVETDQYDKGEQADRIEHQQTGVQFPETVGILQRITHHEK